MIALVGGIASILTAAILLAGISGLAPTVTRLRPWLVVLVLLNAGRYGLSHESLRRVQPVDVALLLCTGLTYAGFWPGPGASVAWWMALAIAQPLLGVPLLLATHTAGRSGVMGGALVLSILMVADGTWTVTAWLGASASVLLLVGDFGTTPRRTSRLLAALLAIGYCALAAWFCWLPVLLLT